jgi:large repetitive protein
VAPDPAPVPVPVPVPVQPTAAQAPAAAPAPLAAPAPATAMASAFLRPAGGVVAGDPLAAPGNAPAPPISGDVVVALQRALDVPDTPHFMGAAVRSAALADLQLVAFNPPAAADFQITGLASFDLTGLHVTTEQLQQSLRSGLFVQQLNQLRDELREQFDLDRTVSVSVAGVSLGLSVVYVLWLVRGGVLLGSYLSALPAWRLLDPLPVLAQPGEEEDEDDEAFDREPDRGMDPLRGFS